MLRLQQIGFWGEVSAGVLLVLAGGSKVFGATTLEAGTIWSQFSTNHPHFAVLVVAAELMVGAALISRKRLELARMLAIALFAGFSAVLAHELTLPSPRLCGCLGNAGGVWRNAVWQLVVSLSVNLVILLMIIIMSMSHARRKTGAYTPE